MRRAHPRPQFIRESWQLLDGEWGFSFDDKKIGIEKRWFNGFESTHQIKVPFTYETKLSGIFDSSHHQVVWYQKKIQINEKKAKSILFEGVDYFSQVWLNGHLIGTHQGAYERFEFELSDFLVEGENLIVVRVEDSLACEQPRGKQRWLKDNFGCWYIQTTGIWKSVWIEDHLHSQRLQQVKMTPDFENDQIIFEPLLHDRVAARDTTYELEIDVSFEEVLVNRCRVTLSHEIQQIILDTRIKEDACWGTKVWRPEQPNLYDVTFRLWDHQGQLVDCVDSYFGMRKISIEKGQVLLNNQKLYQRLILDQGYWAESGITPPSIEAMEKDIDQILALGYNGLRKHQKVEDERFLYLCDEKGVLVWSEMASTYVFNDLAVENFTDEWRAIVQQNYNHPSIITWVPFNESWGIKGVKSDKKQQQFTEMIYHLTKTIDPNRPVITNDGWVHTISDILTLHDYEEFGERFTNRYKDKDKITGNEYQFNEEWYAFADGYEYKGQPVIISELGGIAFTSNEKENWGYGSQVSTQDDFLKRFDKIHESIQKIPYLVGYCYTQLTDVEQEINGLLDVNRTSKLPVSRIREINERRTR